MVLSHFLRHWRPFSRFVPLRSMQLFGALCTPILLEVLQEAAVASSLIILQVAEEPEGPRHLTSAPASKYTPAHHVFLGQQQSNGNLISFGTAALLSFAFKTFCNSHSFQKLVYYCLSCFPTQKVGFYPSIMPPVQLNVADLGGCASWRQGYTLKITRS